MELDRLLERLGAPDDLVEVALAGVQGPTPAAVARIHSRAAARLGGASHRRWPGWRLGAGMAVAAAVVLVFFPPAPVRADLVRGHALLDLSSRTLASTARASVQRTRIHGT